MVPCNAPSGWPAHCYVARFVADRFEFKRLYVHHRGLEHYAYSYTEDDGVRWKYPINPALLDLMLAGHIKMIKFPTGSALHAYWTDLLGTRYDI